MFRAKSLCLLRLSKFSLDFPPDDYKPRKLPDCKALLRIEFPSEDTRAERTSDH